MNILYSYSFLCIENFTKIIYQLIICYELQKMMKIVIFQNSSKKI